MTETAKDESGRVLWERPYTFRRLEANGARIVVDGIAYRVVECAKDGDRITTVLRQEESDG